MILVTGGAGFIGSNIVAALARRGERVAICDWLDNGDKWRNIAKHRVWDLVQPGDLPSWLDRNAPSLTAVVHMGAISATTERDVDLIVRSNFKLSLDLWNRSAAEGWTFVYASSAATYGDGAQGFDDRFSTSELDRLLPLNAYGWSKHAFDRRICQAVDAGEMQPPKWAGLKFFNVYGPNEYHKGLMRSVIAVNYDTIAAGKPLQLFRSYRPEYEDGGQKRDFIWVGDCVSVVLWMLDNAFPSSVYNVGSGCARSWLDLGSACFAALGKPLRVEFTDMPDSLRGRYQYYTQANMAKLRAAGFGEPLTPLEEGVSHYIGSFLANKDPYV